MYLYFDRFGVLKEIISDRPFRNGDSKRDKIYIYVDSDETPSSAWVKYRLPNGTLTTETEFFTGTKTPFELPTEPVRNLKYFSYNHTYTDGFGNEKIGYLGYVITVPTAVLNSSTDSAIIPTENNMVVCQVRFVDSDITSLGAIVFSVETSMGIITDNSINETQYNYLLEKIAEANNNIMVLADITQADLTNVANGKIVYSVAQKQYYVVDSTDQNGFKIAEDGKGILANNRTIPRYRVGTEISSSATFYDVINIIGTNRLSIISTSVTEYLLIAQSGTSILFYALDIRGNKYYSITLNLSTIYSLFSTLFTSSNLTEYVVKTNDANKVYGSSENYTIDTTGYGQIPKRNEAGGISVPTPINSTDATNKAYVDDKITEVLTKSFINVDTTSYPTLSSFLASTGEEGYIYLYPIDVNDLSKGYYQYIWENNSWQYLGSTEIDLSSYATKTYVDGKIVEAKEYTDSGVADAKDYADNDIVTIIDLSTAISDAVKTKLHDNNIRLKYDGKFYEKVSETETAITFSNARLTFDNETSHYTLTNDLIVRSLTYDVWTHNTSNGIAVYTKAQIDTLLSAKQDVINSSNKIASDNVNDTSQTNKFVTQAEKEQITTNQNDIGTLNGEIDRLDERIDNLSVLGRFLSMWNCATGLPETEPETIPYSYQAGDYYVVGVVGTTNYKPSGTSYTGIVSSAVETGEVKVNDYYRYDGEGNWVLVSVADRVITWDSITGKPELYTKSETDALLSPINSSISALETAIANTVGFESITSTSDRQFSQLYAKYGEKPFIIKLNGYSAGFPTTQLNNYIVLLHSLDETNVRYDILYSNGYSNGTTLFSSYLSSVFTATTTKKFATKQDTTEFKVLDGTETLINLASTIIDYGLNRDVFTALYNSQIYLVLINRPLLGGYYIIIGQDGYYRGTDLSQTFATVISGGYTKEYASKEELENEVQKIEDGTTVAGKSKVADNIAPYSNESGALQDEPFINQPTGTANGTEIVTTGDFCELKSKNGNTVVYNQPLNHGDFDSASNWNTYNSTLSVSNNIASMTASGSYGAISRNLGYSLKTGHKYWCQVYTDEAFTNNVRIILGDSRVPDGKGFDLLKTKGYKYGIVTYQENSSNYSNSLVIIQNYSSSGFETVKFSHIKVVDLTQWFGSNANIPQDLIDHPSNFFRYYNGDLSYKTGEIINANGRYLECGQGRNVWDEEVEVGGISTSTGENTTSSSTLRSKNYTEVSPNNEYYFRMPNTLLATGIYVYWYDKNKNFIKLDLANTANAIIKTAPANAIFFRIVITSGYGTTYNHDITISIYYTAEQGGEGYDKYYPYKAPIIIDTGTETLRSAGSVKDIKVPSGVITRNVGSTKLKDLEWSRIEYSNFYFFEAEIDNIYSNRTYNLLCSKYQAIPSNITSWADVPNGYIAKLGNSSIKVRIRDDSYSDATTFKNHFTDDDYLYYELATPTTEQGTPYTRYPDINDYSYMLWKDTNNALVTIPQGASIFYPVNYAGTLDDLVAYVDGDVSKLALKTDVSAEETARTNYDTILQNAIGGTLRQCLCVKESLDFANTDVVDLGSLNWIYDSNDQRFSVELQGISLSADFTGLLCSKYQTIISSTQYSSMPNLSIKRGSSNNIISIIDHSYTDATAFKNAMKGVLLAYEKA